jgi:hypothetical protein
MNWIIEKDRSDDHSHIKWTTVLEKRGISFTLFNYIPFMTWRHVEEALGELSNPVLCHGSINFINKIQKIQNLKPGSICNFKNFECRNYYPHIKEHLLNSDYIIVPWLKLLNTGFSGFRFIRPNSGKKVFTGLVTDFDHLQSDIALDFYKVGPETLFVLSSYKQLEKEWRFYVKKGKIITYSLYNMNGSLCPIKWEDNEAFDLALKTSYLYQPDPIWIIDICKTLQGEYKVLELNSFSCAGLYSCDVDKIVDEVETLEF